MSWTIGRVRGIAIRIHWSLLLVLPLFAYIMAGQYFAEDGLDAASLAWGGALAVTLFASVLVHEFSHSFMAIRLGTQVRSILLMPLGGVSQMESMPEDPRQEFLITVVGPLTNFLIAGPLLIAYYADLVPGGHVADFVRWSGWLNVALGGFNLFLPAFPMDGGRLLRAGLAARIGRLRATQTAAGIGRAIAVILGTLGFLAWGVGGIWFVLIAFFIFIGAGAEERSTMVQVLLGEMRVRDVMTRDVDTLGPDDTLADALDRMKQTRHLAFPVIQEGQVLGILGLDALAHHRDALGDIAVRDAMEDAAQVHPDERAVDALSILQNRRRRHVLVVDGGLVGIVSVTDLEHIVQVLDASRTL